MHARSDRRFARDVRFVFAAYDRLAWHLVSNSAQLRTKTSSFTSNAPAVKRVTPLSMYNAINFADSERRARLVGDKVPVPPSVDRGALRLVRDAEIVNASRPWSAEKRQRMRNDLIAMCK